MCNFFDLPRELRDKIYALLLVRKEPITIIETHIPQRNLECWDPELKLNIRTTWWQNEISKLPWMLQESKIPWVLPRDSNLEIGRSLMTYQICPMKTGDEPYMDIFHTSRQMYDESREIYYSQNKFTIGYATSITTLLAYLYDRPVGSLQYIRDLEICILPAWIRLQMRFWKALCEELNRHCELRNFRLHVFGKVPEVRPSLMIRWEENDGWDNPGSSPFWVQDFIQSGKPQKLTISFLKDHSCNRRNEAFGAWLQRMLFQKKIMLKWDISSKYDRIIMNLELTS